MSCARDARLPNIRITLRMTNMPTSLDFVIAASGFLLTLALLIAAPTAGPQVTVPALASASWWAVGAVIVAQATALLRARSCPRTVTIVVAVLPILAAPVAADAISITSVAVAASVFLAGTRLRGRPLWTAIAQTSIPTLATYLVNLVPSTSAGQSAGTTTPVSASVIVAVAQTAAVVGIPLTLSLVVASRRDERDSARREAQALRREGNAARREHEALVAAAVAGERTAMARDLHDIAAHHMSGIALLASAMERQLDSDTVAARQSARDIRNQSTAVLAEMRRLVGLLRDESAPTAAANALDSIADLVEQRRSAGEDVALEDHRAPTGGEVGALAQLVGYRMVQEALANAAMHAPGAVCSVLLHATAAGVRIRVRNAAPVIQSVDGTENTGGGVLAPAGLEGQGSGFGLVGMRERANLVGAILQYGSTIDRGWEVDLFLPAGTNCQTGVVDYRDAASSE